MAFTQGSRLKLYPGSTPRKGMLLSSVTRISDLTRAIWVNGWVRPLVLSSLSRLRTWLPGLDSLVRAQPLLTLPHFPSLILLGTCHRLWSPRGNGTTSPSTTRQARHVPQRRCRSFPVASYIIIITGMQDYE